MKISWADLAKECDIKYRTLIKAKNKHKRLYYLALLGLQNELNATTKNATIDIRKTNKKRKSANILTRFTTVV